VFGHITQFFEISLNRNLPGVAVHREYHSTSVAAVAQWLADGWDVI
jgi:hypothetical protein